MVSIGTGREGGIIIVDIVNILYPYDLPAISRVPTGLP